MCVVRYKQNKSERKDNKWLIRINKDQITIQINRAWDIPIYNMHWTLKHGELCLQYVKLVTKAVMKQTRKHQGTEKTDKIGKWMVGEYIRSNSHDLLH